MQRVGCKVRAQGAGYRALAADLRPGNAGGVQLQHRLVQPLLQGGVRGLHGCAGRENVGLEGLTADWRNAKMAGQAPITHAHSRPHPAVPRAPGTRPTCVALERIPVPHHLGVVVAFGVVVLPAQQAHLLAQAGRLVGLHVAVALSHLHLGLPGQRSGLAG